MEYVEEIRYRMPDRVLKNSRSVEKKLYRAVKLFKEMYIDKKWGN